LSIAMVSPGHAENLSIGQFQEIVCYVELEVMDGRIPTSITVEVCCHVVQ
jgi:hypothetical protein